LASVIAGELGVFGVRPAVASDILAGKRVEIKPAEGAFWRSFSGDQSPEDLETALQLVYKLFTSRYVVDGSARLFPSPDTVS
jgi:hypothetical protein